MRHSAVLLAGGKSSRMGKDKAEILVDGEPLWFRQLELLRQTQPVEILISGLADGPYAAAGYPIVTDELPDQGPLGGISSVMAKAAAEWVLVLAVDVPFVTAEFLRCMVHQGVQTGKGIIPIHSDGRLEPLVAVYPRAALPHARANLHAGDRKLANFIQRLEAAGLTRRLPINPQDARLFTNWNSPADVEADT
jgi:molybdopterin-guanine dinucleotide biosynthesis protein A